MSMYGAIWSVEGSAIKKKATNTAIMACLTYLLKMKKGAISNFDFNLQVTLSNVSKKG